MLGLRQESDVELNSSSKRVLLTLDNFLTKFMWPFDMLKNEYLSLRIMYSLAKAECFSGCFTCKTLAAFIRLGVNGRKPVCSLNLLSSKIALNGFSELLPEGNVALN